MSPAGPVSYEVGANLTYHIVGLFKDRDPAPEFAFPPPEVGLIASLDHVGARLIRNEAARDLLLRLLGTFVILRLEPPTAMMLRVCLEKHGIPITYVSLSELGLEVPQA